MKVSGKICIYDGIIRIIYQDKAKEIILTAMGTQNDERITLDDCLNLIGYDGSGTVIVIFDSALHGEIFQYGNYGDFWTKYGKTQGYA